MEMEEQEEKPHGNLFGDIEVHVEPPSLYWDSNLDGSCIDLTSDTNSIGESEQSFVDFLSKNKHLMASAEVSPIQSPVKSITLLSSTKNTFNVSPAKPTSLTPNKEGQNTASKRDIREALNIKTTPRLDLAKTPTSANNLATRARSAGKKDKFSHVVSPVGAYIRSRVLTPLKTNIKTISDGKNSNVFRKLDTNSQNCKSKLPNSHRLPKKLAN